MILMPERSDRGDGSLRRKSVTRELVILAAIRLAWARESINGRAADLNEVNRLEDEFDEALNVYELKARDIRQRPEGSGGSDA